MNKDLFVKELKFKAYALDYDYPNQSDCIIYENVYITADGVNCDGDIFEVNNKDFFVCQYTRLKDKKGKEIYEGDIVKGEYWRPCEIIYNEYKACYMVGDVSIEEYFKMFEEKVTLEVIGNIYENQELLKSGVKE